MYIDLNIPILDILEKNRLFYSSTLRKQGYSAIALNYICSANEKPRHSSELPTLPEPEMENNRLLSSGFAMNKELKQYTRITCILEDMSAVHSLSSSHQILKSYDLVAACPETERIFEHLCQHAEIDIITFDSHARISYAIRKKYVDIAIQRGITFELKYANAIADTTARRYFFANADLIMRATKGKNIILSSGATREILLRSPADLVNIGCLLGMSYGKSVNSLSSSCQNAIEHSCKRKSNNFAVNAIRHDEKESESMILS